MTPIEKTVLLAYWRVLELSDNINSWVLDLSDNINSLHKNYRKRWLYVPYQIVSITIFSERW